MGVLYSVTNNQGGVLVFVQFSYTSSFVGHTQPEARKPVTACDGVVMVCAHWCRTALCSPWKVIPGKGGEVVHICEGSF